MCGSLRQKSTGVILSSLYQLRDVSQALRSRRVGLQVECPSNARLDEPSSYPSRTISNTNA